MRHYPFFVTEVIFLLLFLMIIPITYLYNGPISYAAALVAGIIFIVVSITDQKKFTEFEGSVEKIKGLLSWETDFFSTGRLIFDYKGEKVRYSTCIGATRKSHIPVSYHIQLNNKGGVSFDMSPGGRWLGAFSVRGDRKFLDTLRQEITAFNRKYALKRMRNTEGILDISVQLDFIANQPPPPDKLEDMTAFLSDFLEFGYRVNSRLKSKRKPRKKAKKK
jgi:hypothetical protein